MTAVPEFRLNSVEYVRVQVNSKTRTGLQLSAAAVKIAVVAKGTEPVAGDFVTAQWEAPPAAKAATARLIHTFDTLGQFDAYVQYTDNPEVPIKYAGRFQVK